MYGGPKETVEYIWVHEETAAMHFRGIQLIN